MKTLVFKLLLVATPLLICSCSKNNDSNYVDEPDIIETPFIIDSSKNAFYIDTIEYDFNKGVIEYHGQENKTDGYLFSIYLLSDGLEYDGENASGNGSFVNIDVFSETKEFLKQGNYTYNNSMNNGSFKCSIVPNFIAESMTFDSVYKIYSGELTVTVNNNEYELTIAAFADHINEETDEIISVNHEIFVHYKGALLEVDFYTDPALNCGFSTDTIDFTFGIEYDDPNLYLIPGEQSDLSDIYVDEVIDAIGTPSNDLSGVLKVCHWVNQNFTWEDAGGGMIGKVTVDELFEVRKFYGCHSLALLISSIVREFGTPALLVETADVQWAYDYYNNEINHFAGHVMSEIFVGGKWILFDNNCTYVEEYDYENPYISLRHDPGNGLFVFAKGVDTWDYTDKDENFTHEQMIYFSENVYCFEDLFYKVVYEWGN